MTHADAVREAKERVVECACIETACERGHTGAITKDVVVWDAQQHRRLAVDEYEALVAQTCATCGGTGTPFCLCQPASRCNCKPCPAACDNGKRTAALSPSSDGSKEVARD